VFTIFGMTNAQAIALFLGAEGDNLAPCADYLVYFFSGTLPIFLLYIPLQFLPIIGRPSRAMTVQIIFSILNVGAFCLLELGFSMGMASLALARTLASLCAFIVGALFLLGGKSPLAFCRIRGAAAKIKEILLAGSPMAVEYLVGALQLFFVNQIMVRGGAGAFLPCWSLIVSTQIFVAHIIEGIAGTTQSLSSIAFGEKDYRNIRVIFKKLLVSGSAIIIPISIAIVPFRFRIIALFGQRDPSLAGASAVGLCIMAGSLILILLNELYGGTFTALRRARITNAMSICRFFLISIVPAWLLFPYYGINAVFSMLIISETGGLLALTVCLFISRKRKAHLSPFLLLDREEEKRIQAIDFSVLNDTAEITDAAAKIGAFCKEHNIPAKERFHVSLAIEEMLLMIKEHAFKPDAKEYCDVRIATIDGALIMRIRDIGKHFNPVEYYYDNKDTQAGFMETLGIGMVLKMANDVEYRETYGVNNLIITIVN
jgi:Na+-driven multidrug efflux pump/anti-sigma regulatory factor (Ser/Thr protein kinase)